MATDYNGGHEWGNRYLYADGWPIQFFACEVSPDGRKLVALGWSSVLQYSDADTGLNSKAISMDFPFISGDSYNVVIMDDKSVYLWLRENEE